MDQNTSNPPNDNGNNGNGGNGSGNGERHVFTETFVFTGTGQSFLATMQNLMNRFVSGPQAQQQQQHQHQQEQPPPQREQSTQSQSALNPDGTRRGDPESLLGQSIGQDPVVDRVEDVAAHPTPHRRTVIEVPDESDDEMPGLIDVSDNEAPPMPRPIRPLPRNGVRPASQPHAHFHAHTPNGTIDLFTFSVAPGEAIPQPQPGSGPSFTFNLGAVPSPEAFAGFEAFLLNLQSMEKDREPDVERAKVLLRGMEVVPEGLVRRLERAGGVPGGHGNDESGSAAGCAVCWGPLLDEVDPGEWETALPAKQKEKTPDADEKEKSEEKKPEENELNGRIVALPCAHVYHAECLLPWFSRQTTCPTCRLDVDPDSLTWTPRPQSRPHNFQPPPPGAQQPGVPISQTPPEAPQAGTFQLPALDLNDPNAPEIARFTQFMGSPPFAGWPMPSIGTPFMNNLPRYGLVPPPSQRQQQQPQPQQQHAPRQQFLPFPVLRPFHPTDSPSPLNNPPPPPPNSLPSLSQAVPAPPSPPPQAHPTENQPPPLPPVHDPPPPPPQHNYIRLPPLPMFFAPGAPSSPQSNPPPAPRRERRKWTPPEPVGKTLRQRVEQKERELGLRCDDAVCGVAPTDDDPIVDVAAEAVRLQIHAAYDAQGKACEHSFHPACLVMSARVAGVSAQLADEDDSEVNIACPACRAEGSLSRAEWETGVRAAEAEMA